MTFVVHSFDVFENLILLFDYGLSVLNFSILGILLFANVPPHVAYNTHAYKLAISFNSTFRYIDDVLSLNNSKFGDYVDRIYPIELEIKDTTDTVKSASYLDLHLEIDNEGSVENKTLGQKRRFQFSNCELSISK